MLRHRVEGYRGGNLERRYESVGLEEDVFVKVLVASAVHFQASRPFPKNHALLA
jgi:hypothetical protein